MAETPWLTYRLKKLTEMRPYVEGESLAGVTVTQANRDNGNPTKGDMIARDPVAPDYQWVVPLAVLEHDYEPALQAVAEPPVRKVEPKKGELHTTLKPPAHVDPEPKVEPVPVPRLKLDERKEKDDDDEPKKKDDPKKR